METQTNLSPSVGQIILDQINASDFWARARWGVKQMLTSDNTLTLNCTRGNKIVITLDPSDTYSIKIGNVRRFEFKVKESAEDIYVDVLVSTIDRLFSAAYGNT